MEKQLEFDFEPQEEQFTISIDDLSTTEHWSDWKGYNPSFTMRYELENDLSVPDYKFNEGSLIEEFKEYINSTYTSHYSKEKFQATEFIIDGGHGTGFCIGNVLKYAQRYGKKGTATDARKDLMKVLHYALIQLHIHDSEHLIKSES